MKKYLLNFFLCLSLMSTTSFVWARTADSDSPPPYSETPPPLKDVNEDNMYVPKYPYQKTPEKKGRLSRFTSAAKKKISAVAGAAKRGASSVAGAAKKGARSVAGAAKKGASSIKGGMSEALNKLQKTRREVNNVRRCIAYHMVDDNDLEMNDICLHVEKTLFNAKQAKKEADLPELLEKICEKTSKNKFKGEAACDSLKKAEKGSTKFCSRICGESQCTKERNGVQVASMCDYLSKKGICEDKVSLACKNNEKASDDNMPDAVIETSVYLQLYAGGEMEGGAGMAKDLEDSRETA